MATCLILGASRGIGRELAHQYAAVGERVIATVRREQDGRQLAADCARVLLMDLAHDDTAAGLQRELAGERVDLAIISAGVGGPSSEGLDAPGPAEFDAVMRTNVLVSMRLIPVLASIMSDAGGKLVVLSSRLGSIGLAANASYWLYRASKAALNSVLKSASIELGPRGIVCMSLHPGWVRTDMGGAHADLSVEESVSSMRRVIAAANRSHNGRFLNYNGEQLEW